ncbi:MAG: sigma-70 family RNA polymerase sigma factor [Pirellulales bacterium]
MAIFARNQRRVFAYIGTLLPNIADAEEVMQETSIILWRKWNQFDRSRDFVRWANGIAHLEVQRYLRMNQSNKLQFNDSVLARISDEVERQSDRQADRQAALIGCMQKLTAGDRDLVERRYLREVNVAEIAQLLNRPLKSIYRSLDRVRDQLFECVQRSLSAGDRD